MAASHLPALSPPRDRQREVGLLGGEVGAGVLGGDEAGEAPGGPSRPAAEEVTFFTLKNLEPILKWSLSSGGMARFVVRKLGGTGDSLVTVEEQELENHLRREFGKGLYAALLTTEGARLVGDNLELVMGLIQLEVIRGRGELEVLLIPRVTHGC
jgi:hypothetical protein